MHAGSRIRFLLDELLLPLVHSYFAMLSRGGLQGEWHAQNVLFGFDTSWHCVATVLRDLESVDRDLPLMALADRPTDLASYPYKCVESGKNYAIRHSFMFDHKFGEYLLAPLIDQASIEWGVRPAAVDSSVVDCVMSHLTLLPDGFFPADSCWYKFAPRVIDQSSDERPYVRIERPRFRARF